MVAGGKRLYQRLTRPARLGWRDRPLDLSLSSFNRAYTLALLMATAISTATPPPQPCLSQRHRQIPTTSIGPPPSRYQPGPDPLTGTAISIAPPPLFSTSLHFPIGGDLNLKFTTRPLLRISPYRSHLRAPQSLSHRPPQNQSIPAPPTGTAIYIASLPPPRWCQSVPIDCTAITVAPRPQNQPVPAPPMVAGISIPPPPRPLINVSLYQSYQ